MILPLVQIKKYGGNLPPRKMMGIESCGMLLSAVKPYPAGWPATAGIAHPGVWFSGKTGKGRTVRR